MKTLLTRACAKYKALQRSYSDCSWTSSCWWQRSGHYPPSCSLHSSANSQKMFKKRGMHQQDFSTGSFANISRSYQHLNCLQPSKTGKATENTVRLAGIQEGYLRILLPPTWRDFRRMSTIRAISTRGGKRITNNCKERSAPSIVLGFFPLPFP